MGHYCEVRRKDGTLCEKVAIDYIVLFDEKGEDKEYAWMCAEHYDRYAELGLLRVSAAERDAWWRNGCPHATLFEIFTVKNEMPMAGV
jgi:hypothetical protein